MPSTTKGSSSSVPLAAQTVLDVLPRSADAEARGDGSTVELVVADERLRIGWAGDGNLRSVRQLLANHDAGVDVVAARRMSPAARELLADAGIGWADQSGAAEIAVGGIVVSREGRPREPERLTRWTPAVMAVAEALLCGTQATVAATEEATGLSTGSCTNALRFLTDQGLLTADAKRGRGSARRIDDPDQLLDAYAAAVEAARPRPALQVGLQGRDLLDALSEVGETWTSRGVAWAATGGAAAAVIAPLLTSISSIEVYIDAESTAGLEAPPPPAPHPALHRRRRNRRPQPPAAQ
jgi:hypothetical protein